MLGLTASTAFADDKPIYGVLMKTLSNPFWGAMEKGVDVASNIFLGRELTRSVLGVRFIDVGRMRGEAEAMVARLGARIPSVTQMTGQLSGGQQQSVAIARALTFNPKLVIMDEPTAALAVREVEHVLDLIRALKRDGISVILISHRLTDVFSVCDRIVVLRQGQVIADDATRDTSMNAVVAHIVGAMDERLEGGHA